MRQDFAVLWKIPDFERGKSRNYASRPIRREQVIPLIDAACPVVALAKTEDCEKGPFLDGNYLGFPILNIFVPQVGHTPWVAGLPFFIVILLGSFISLFSRHFTQ
jgi:hypothetical protein